MLCNDYGSWFLDCGEGNRGRQKKIYSIQIEIKFGKKFHRVTNKDKLFCYEMYDKKVKQRINPQSIHIAYGDK